jgi:hypothetical protein
MSAIQKIIILAFLLKMICCQEMADIPDLECGKKVCYRNYGTCFGNGTTCICNSTHETYPEDSVVMCNYTRKSQLIAFLLECFITFGAGHIYVMNLTQGIIKFLFWALGYSLFISLRVLSKKREENDATTLIISLGGCICCVGMVIWQLIDVIMFGLNSYQDGYGIDLNPW